MMEFKIYSWLLQESKMCDKAVDHYFPVLEFVPDWYKTRKMCNTICSRMLLDSKNAW